MATVPAAFAETEEIGPIDPQVTEIVSRAASFLAGQGSMSVNWLVSYDEVLDGREKITHLRSGQNVLVRGEGFYSYVENGPETREYYFDGQAFQIYASEEDAYVLAPFTGSFEELIDRASAEYGVRLPIWTVMTVGNRSELLETAESAAYLGETRIAGRTAHHVALSNYDSDWQMWISTDEDRPVLLMLVGTDPYKQGWPQYRVFFSEWNFAPDVAEGQFTFVPGENTERMAWPKTNGEPLREGEEADQNGEEEK